MMDGHQRVRTVGTNATFLLPLAYTVFGALGVLYMVGIGSGMSAILMQEGNFGLDLSFLGPFQYRAPGMSEGMIQVPLMLFWGGICALMAWYVRARPWSAVIAIVALLCPIGLDTRLQHAAMGVLTLVLIAGMVGTGISAGRDMLEERTRAGVASSISGVIALFIAFSGITLWFCSFLGTGTGFSILFMMWLIFIFPPFLAATIVLGYYGPQVWFGVRRLPKTQCVLIPLLPIIALLPYCLAINAYLNRQSMSFMSRPLPLFLRYVDAKLAPFPMQSGVRYGYVSPDMMEVICEFDRPDGIHREFRGRLPINWTRKVGFKQPVDFRWIEYSVVTDLEGRPLGNKLQCNLPDRAALNRFLDRIDARPVIRRANWRLATDIPWHHPVTGKTDPRYHSWEAICRIDGADLSVAAMADWRLVVEPEPRQGE